MIKKLIGAAVVAAAAMGSSAAQASCGAVSIADMNWSSATFIAYVDKFILENGYGCDAELVPGDTMPTGTSMTEKGEPDIAPELWSNSMKEVLDKAVAEKRLRFAGKSLSDGGEEGFWVPKYMVDKDPSLATIDGILKNKNLFPHPEDDSMAAFYGCPAGWNCQISSANNFRALDMEDKGWELIDPGSGAGLSGSIAKAYERGEGWFGYYWAPTDILGKYEMVKVTVTDTPDFDHFVKCTTQENCENPKPNMYPPSPVHTVTTEAFAAKAPEAYEYLTKRAWQNAQMNKILAWMADNQADGEIAAEWYMKKNMNQWSKWVSADAAAKIKAALQ